MTQLPNKWVELYTQTCGGVLLFGYINNPTPSGCDRPRLIVSTNLPIALEDAVKSVQPGVEIWLDGKVYAPEGDS